MMNSAGCNSNQLKKIVYPKGIFVMKYDKKPIDIKFSASIVSFIYGFMVGLLVRSVKRWLHNGKIKAKNT